MIVFAKIARTFLVVSLLVMTSLSSASCRKQPASTDNQTPGSASPGAITSPSPQASPVEVKTYHGSGIVTKIVRENPYDKSLASVELNHGEIVGLMPAMRMEFYVKGKSLLDGLNVGDLVDFTIEEKGATEIISEIKKK